jgi:hypothetical protein
LIPRKSNPTASQSHLWLAVSFLADLQDQGVHKGSMPDFEHHKDDFIFGRFID